MIVPTDRLPRFVCSSFTVPKKGKTGKYDAYRVVRNGSFKTNATTSINQWIDPEKCKMHNLPNLRTYAHFFEGKKVASLRDLSDYFRQIGLDEAHRKFAGYSLFSLYTVDARQPYGFASAPANAQYISTLIIWIFNHCVLKEKELSELADRVLVHIDDFALATEDPHKMTQLIGEFDRLLHELGVKVSHHKSETFVSNFETYGANWQLQKQTVGIPRKKLKAAVRLIILLIRFRIGSGQAFETLAGKLMYFAQYNHATKAIIYHLCYHIQKQLRQIPNYKRTLFIVPISFIRIMIFWLNSIKYLSDVPITYLTDRITFNVYAATDASDKGAGFILANRFGHYTFKPAHKQWHINCKEAHCILTMIHSAPYLVTGKILYIYCDNEACVGAINKTWSKSAKFMKFIAEIAWACIAYRAIAKLQYVQSDLNVLPDALSRLHEEGKAQLFHSFTEALNMNLHHLKADYFDNFNPDLDLAIAQRRDQEEMDELMTYLSLPYEQRATKKYPFYDVLIDNPMEQTQQPIHHPFNP